MIDDEYEWYNYVLGTLYSGGLGFTHGIGNFIAGIGDIWNCDGKVSQAELEQMYISQFLSSDYSIYEEYGSDKYKQMISKDYSSITPVTKEQEEILKYAASKELPLYEVLYGLGAISQEEYNKYLILSKTSDEDLEFYLELNNSNDIYYIITLIFPKIYCF